VHKADNLPPSSAVVTKSGNLKFLETFRSVEACNGIVLPLPLHTMEGRKGNWISHILHMHCLLKHAIKGKTEGRIEVTGRRGRRSKKLLDDLKTEGTGN